MTDPLTRPDAVPDSRAEVVDSPDTDLDRYIDDLTAFVIASPTPIHTTHVMADRLSQAGWSLREERATWPASRPGECAMVRRDGALIAWKAGASAGPSSALRVLGAHSDSPGFVLKPNPPFATEGWAQIGVEVYGGPLLNSWLDRDLAIAGCVMTADGTTHLVQTGPIARIPQLAIHLDREVNNGLKLDPQRHLQPVIGTAPLGVAPSEGQPPGLIDFRAIIADAAGVDPTQIIGSDLRVVDTQAPARIGVAREFLASGRLDNLSSTHAGLLALLECEPAPGDIAVLAVFDHEEVGSESRTGALGPILTDVMDRVLRSFGAGAEDIARSRADSWVLSADTGHAAHPNYGERHDPNVRPQPGRGPMRKVNAKQRYASDLHGEALWHRICRQAGVSTQVFVSHNAVPCGTTIGPLTASRTGIRTVDVGVPLLSMHSARELAHVEDLHGMHRAAVAFFNGGERRANL